MSRYVVAIPPSGAPCPDKQSLHRAPAQTRQQGMIAMLGVAPS